MPSRSTQKVFRRDKKRVNLSPQTMIFVGLDALALGISVRHECDERPLRFQRGTRDLPQLIRISEVLADVRTEEAAERSWWIARMVDTHASERAGREARSRRSAV